MRTLFKDTEEIKPMVSGIDAALEIENIESALELATEKIIEVIGSEVYALAESHYYSINWENESFGLLNKLVRFIQKPIANFAFYEHLPFMAIRISNDSITRHEGEGKKSAYKYQIDDVRNALLQTAYKQFDNLIKFLDGNATLYQQWVKEKEYKIGNLIVKDEKYYRCETTHVSNEVFINDLANWKPIDKSIIYNAWQTEKDYKQNDLVVVSGFFYRCVTDHVSGNAIAENMDNWEKVDKPEEITFWQWTESTEYKESKKTLFDSYLTFNKIVNIDNSAYFFAMLATTINELISENIKPFLDVKTLRTELYYNILSEENRLLLPKIRRYLAYKSFADALLTFGFNMLPAPWKQTLENEISKETSIKSNSIIFVRENLSAIFQNKADAYYLDIESHIQMRKILNEPLHFRLFEPEEKQYANEKFVSTL